MPHVSLARVKVWMMTSNVERAPSRPLGRWEVEAIVDARGGGEEGGPERQFEWAVNWLSIHYIISP